MQLTHGDSDFLLRPRLPRLLWPHLPASIRPFVLLRFALPLALGIAIAGAGCCSSGEGFRFGESGGAAGGEDFDDPFVPDFSVVGLAPHVDDKFGG